MCTEIPKWHIESKASKVSGIARNKIIKWVAQCNKDCPPDKYWVIIVSPDRRDKLAIVNKRAFTTLLFTSSPTIRMLKEELDVLFLIEDTPNFNDKFDSIDKFHASQRNCAVSPLIGPTPYHAIGYITEWDKTTPKGELVYVLKGDAWTELVKKLTGL